MVSMNAACNSYILECHILPCIYFLHFHAFLRRPWVFSRALGCGARRGPACTPRRTSGRRAGCVARALGVQSCEIWQEITGLLSAKLDPSKTLENPHVRHSSANTITTLASSFPRSYSYGHDDACVDHCYACVVMMYACMHCVCAPCRRARVQACP